MLHFFEQISTFELVLIFGSPIFSVLCILWYYNRLTGSQSDAMRRREADVVGEAGEAENPENRRVERGFTKDERIRRLSIVAVLVVLAINLIISFFDKN